MSVFSDPVLSGQFLKSRGWPLYTGSTVIIEHCYATCNYFRHSIGNDCIRGNLGKRFFFFFVFLQIRLTRVNLGRFPSLNRGMFYLGKKNALSIEVS